jgi:hypothetical protein
LTERYYRTVCACWAEADDPAWAALLPPRHRLRLGGGVGLAVPAADVDPVRAQVLDAHYPPLWVTISATAFAVACTPSPDHGEAARSVVRLCAHATIHHDCTGCWARWWWRGAQTNGIALPRRTLTGAEL